MPDAGVLDHDRTDDGRDLRTQDRHEWLLRGQRLSLIFGTDSFQISRVEQGASFLDQQYRLIAVDYRRDVQRSLPSEDCFKWIKQHLRIKKFLGTNENAVKTKIWCAVSTYMLIAIVNKELQLDAPLYTLLQILSVSVFENNQLSCALQPRLPVPETRRGANQLNLFHF
jgi:hypothetical protein